MYVCKVGQNHEIIRAYGVHTVFLAAGIFHTYNYVRCVYTGHRGVYDGLYIMANPICV